MKIQTFTKPQTTIEEGLEFILNHFAPGLVRRLDFNPSRRIRKSLASALKIGYLPISFENLRITNSGLYDLINYVMPFEPKVKLGKVGNSFRVTIPAVMIQDLGWKEGDILRVGLVNGDKALSIHREEKRR